MVHLSLKQRRLLLCLDIGCVHSRSAFRSDLPAHKFSRKILLLCCLLRLKVLTGHVCSSSHERSFAPEGQVLKLLALAEKEDEDFRLSVQVTALDQSHPLARIGRWDMGVVYHTDFMGIISAVIEEKGPVPTSAAVLRDMINIYAAR